MLCFRHILHASRNIRADAFSTTDLSRAQRHCSTIATQSRILYRHGQVLSSNFDSRIFHRHDLRHRDPRDWHNIHNIRATCLRIIYRYEVNSYFLKECSATSSPVNLLHAQITSLRLCKAQHLFIKLQERSLSIIYHFRWSWAMYRAVDCDKSLQVESKKLICIPIVILEACG